MERKHGEERKILSDRLIAQSKEIENLQAENGILLQRATITPMEEDDHQAELIKSMEAEVARVREENKQKKEKLAKKESELEKLNRNFAILSVEMDNMKAQLKMTDPVEREKANKCYEETVLQHDDLVRKNNKLKRANEKLTKEDFLKQPATRSKAETSVNKSRELAHKHSAASQPTPRAKQKKPDRHKPNG